MTQFDSYYDNNSTSIHQTNIEETINILNKYVDSTYEDNILSKVSSFLESEEIKEFIEDSLRNFVYKKVFNLAYMLYKKKKESYYDQSHEFIETEKFIEDFKELFEKKFNYQHNDVDDLETLAKEFYKLVISPENGRNDKFTKKLKNYAKNNEISKCYLCGKDVNFKEINNNITLYNSFKYTFKDAKSDKEDEKALTSYKNRIKNLQPKINQNFDLNNFFTKKEFGKIKYILTESQLEKTGTILNKNHPSYQNMHNEIIEILTEEQISLISEILNLKEKEFLDTHFKSVNLNKFSSIFNKTYHLENNNKCEIEHNFPVQWGGDLSNNNLFVACHKCNNKKGNIAFYTDVDYSNVFANSTDISNISGNIKSEVKIALKIKQKFKCKSSFCENNLLSNMKFYIISETGNEEIDFFTLSMYCDECIENEFANKNNEKEFVDKNNEAEIAKLRKEKKEEFIKENCINI